MLEWLRSLFPCRECARLRAERDVWEYTAKAATRGMADATLRAEEAEARVLELSRLVHMIAVSKGPDLRMRGEV